MPQPITVTKAHLVQLETAQTSGERSDTRIEVQFNPETLKVSYANQIVQPTNPSGQAGDGMGSANPPVLAGTQYVGKGSTKLSVQLVFDVTGELSPANAEIAQGDVRNLTKRVVAMITPQRGDTADPNAMVPPRVRFAWGSFRFEGIVESVEENLDYFSPQGRPLRATVSLGMVQQEISFFDPHGAASPGSTPGSRPRTAAPAGATLQGLADAVGAGDRWQQIASANGIENPRRLMRGQLLDLKPGR